MSRIRIAFAVLVLLCASASAGAQTCRDFATTGGSATVSVIAGQPVAGSPASTNVLDNQWFEISNLFGITAPSVRTTFSTDVEKNIAVPWGGVFSNPTDTAITVTSVDITSTAPLFRNVRTMISPTSGWAFVSANTIRWTGSVSVAANSGFRFLTYARAINAAATGNVTMTVFTSAGTFTSESITVTVRDVPARRAADAWAGFAGTLDYMAVTAPTAFFLAQVSDANAGTTGGDIAAGAVLSISMPAGWSNVTTIVGAPFVLVSITQPTAVTEGSVVVRTTANIGNDSSPATSLIITATVPPSSLPDLEPVTFTLNGSSVDGFPIRSVNHAVVQVAASATDAVAVEFQSAPIGPGPVRQIDFRTDFNVAGASGVMVQVDVFNNATAAWETIAAVTPTTIDTSVTRTFTSDFEPYVGASGRMRIRFVSPGAAARRLRIDFIQWSTTTGFTVDNATGSDSNSGNVAHPFATIAHALRALPASGAVYVQVGNSRTGTAYDDNLSISTSGTPSCPLLIQGVPDANGKLPLVRAVAAGVDSGFLVGANDVTVDRFEIDGGQVGLYADVGAARVTFSNCIVHVPDFSYGILLQTNSRSVASNNVIDGSAANATFGVWDFSGSGNRIDGNRISGFASAEALVATQSIAPIVQRNIVRGAHAGIHLAHCTGPVNLFNNTVDSNSYLGVYSEDTRGSVMSRNNIITNNATGWAWDSLGTIDSNYDDVFHNTSDYSFHGAVTRGANSISADPQVLQTTNPFLPTYYKLSSGSPCVNAGTPVGLPYNGPAPDIGAVEN